MKYPFIGEAKLTGAKVLFFTAGCGNVLDGETYEIGNYNERFSMPAFIDITPEYLANTYGEVVSPEHAEFIIELGKNARAEISTSWDNGKFFNFFTSSSGALHLGFFDEHLAKDSGEKQIKIPLPPKADKQDLSEWPLVGDEVLTNTNNRKLAEIKDKIVKVIGKCTHSDGTTILTVEHIDLGVFAVANGSWIKKPKTARAELRGKLETILNSYVISGKPASEHIDEIINVFKKPR